MAGKPKSCTTREPVLSSPLPTPFICLSETTRVVGRRSFCQHPLLRLSNSTRLTRASLSLVVRAPVVGRSSAEPLGPMEVAKVHAKSDGLAEHVFETCRFGRYRTVVHD